jgi:pyruvate dehydrogenase E2 component (dihydrolipoamide acetyltransferase)
MAETVIMPKLGFDMAEGTLVRWVKTEGEAINKGDVLAEIETDKATVEVESSADGTVLKHLVDEGAIVPVSTAIAVVGAEGEDISDQIPTGGDETAPSAAEPEQEEVEAPPAVPEPASPAGTMPAKAAVTTPEGRIKASPLARRMAEDKDIDLGNVQGTGPGGRIVRRDIEAALSGRQPPAVSDQPAPEAPAEKATPLAPLPAFSAEPRADETVPLTKLRQAIGRRMVEVKQQVPHFYVTHDYKMEAVMEMRKQINDMLPEGEKLSVNDFLVKAVALALREFPNLNASLDGDEVIRHGAVNVGNAVAVEGGLLTVVCKDADQKSLRQISLEVRGMAARVRSGKVKPEDIEGSTFSISNLGMFDVEHFIAIINPPEAAILAVGSALDVPVVADGEIVPGCRMKATISVDHRVSDGAEAAQFMQALAKYLEEPLRLLV